MYAVLRKGGQGEAPMHTVGQVADMAGISVRTLHHYDAIGLLKPSHIGENGYRYYDRDALLRLQQILIHRELGIPLGEIGAILNAPNFDRLAALQDQRERVEREAERYAEMLRTINRTIAEITEKCAMNEADLYSGIVDPQQQAEYEAWLVATYGPEMARSIEASKQNMKDWTDADMAQAMGELAASEQGLAQAMRDGVPADDARLDPLLEKHRAWMGRIWGRACEPEAYAGLADMYLSHPDFVARYETVAPGFSQFLPKAMKAWAARQG